MENELTALFTAREAALSAWDATEYNRIDGRIREIHAFMVAEINLGLRADPIFTCEVP